MTVLLWLNYQEYLCTIKQNLSRHEQGFRVASIDRDYNSRSMDFLKTSGFLFLGYKINICVLNLYTHPVCSHPLCLLCLGWPRLVLFAIMNLCPRGLVHWAPCCSSWGIPARGTSLRSIINAHGYTSYEFVANGNTTVSRTLESNMGLLNTMHLVLSWVPSNFQLRMVLAVLLILSQNGLYLVEQPAQSLLYLHRRWQHFANRISFESCCIRIEKMNTWTY